MSIQKLPGYPEACKTMAANMSPRAKALAELESYVDGTQYDGRPDWFSDEAPMFERAPCIVYPIAKNAIDSNIDLVLGEGRWPQFTSRPAEDESDYETGGLDEEDSGVVDYLVNKVIKQARLPAVSREALASAQACGSVASIVGARAGKLVVNTVRAGWCEPELDVDGSCIRLVIQYPYLEQYKEKNGPWSVRCKMYRRVIDAVSDTTFLPADADSSGREPKWIVDPKSSINHGLGFCPAHWYPFMKGCSIVGQYDGKAIHATQLDEIRAHDMALSQRHRAAIYAGDPQWTETGVDPGYNPSQTGRVVGMPGTINGGGHGPGNMVHTHYASSPAEGSGRRKGPNKIWQYESSDSKVELHTLPGDALKSIDEHARDLRTKIAESLAVVFLDHETAGKTFTISGKALAMLRQRQTDRCDQIRDDFGDNYLQPILGMLLRTAYVLGQKKGAIRLPALDKAMPILMRFEEDDLAAA